MEHSTRLSPPARRPLRVFAFDPSRGKLLGNEMQVDIRYREVAPGPADIKGGYDQVAVVDYDVSLDTYYTPVDLDDPRVLIRNGLAPSEADPRFHQQMVYAVVCDTIEQFESALGRRIHWRRAERPLNAPKGWLDDDILTLMLYPHAMQQANAFYSPEAHGILFGYFKAGPEDVGRSIPGQTVFTCLSHDIIVHETTHAILDGQRGHFLEQTNPDVAAFHEAFSDLAALFRHFSHREVLLDAVQRTGGRLYTPALKGRPLADQAAASWLTAGQSEPNPLIELAGQFGEALGMRQGLRSAIGKPKTLKQLRNINECHERGSILVAAVFDAFFTVYIQRAAGHFRVYREGGGFNRQDIPASLAEALCDEAGRMATEFFRICARALDYLPPVDVTFGDFLRAVMTSESDYDAEDDDGIREAWMQAFRRREILPDEAVPFSEEALRWPVFANTLKLAGVPFGGPLGYTYAERRRTAKALSSFVDKHRSELNLDPKLPYSIPSFHPVYRADRSGNIRWDLIAEVVQTHQFKGDPYPIRGGATLVISTHGTVGGHGDRSLYLRYAISKPLREVKEGRKEDTRRGRQENFLKEQGIRPDTDLRDLRVDFGLIHGEA